jgi:hypothetical protein
MEWRHFIKFVSLTPKLKPYRTEWMLYHEEYRICGCVDAIHSYQSRSGQTKFVMFDWKRTKTELTPNGVGKYLDHQAIGFMRNNTFWKFVIQLNTYRIMLKDKYNMTVDKLFVISFHPDRSNFVIVKIPLFEVSLRRLLKSREVSK